MSDAHLNESRCTQSVHLLQIRVHDRWVDAKMFVGTRFRDILDSLGHNSSLRIKFLGSRPLLLTPCCRSGWSVLVTRASTIIRCNCCKQTVTSITFDWEG